VSVPPAEAIDGVNVQSSTLYQVCANRAVNRAVNGSATA
jgi:hypothetical protein